jgi:hypothetical protein
VPLEELGLGSQCLIIRDADLSSVQRVVDAPVGVVSTELGTHGEAPVRPHRDIAKIEQSVQISSQRKPVSNLMCAAPRVRPDVRRIEYGKRVFGLSRRRHRRRRRLPRAGSSLAPVVVGRGAASRSEFLFRLGGPIVQLPGRRRPLDALIP